MVFLVEFNLGYTFQNGVDVDHTDHHRTKCRLRFYDETTLFIVVLRSKQNEFYWNKPFSCWCYAGLDWTPSQARKHKGAVDVYSQQNNYVIGISL
jgi:hypothetical protein